MKALLVALAVVSGGMMSASVAQARPEVRYSQQFTCSHVQAIVSRFGEALIYQRSHFTDNDLYDIAYSSVCPDFANRSWSAPYFVETKDNSQCFVGYRCRQRTP